MIEKKKLILILLASVSIFLLIGCRTNVSIVDKSDFINKEQSKDDNIGNESEKKKLLLPKAMMKC